MYGLSIGVASIDESLPRPAYAILSGLNAATVGVIALAAVELSMKAITDETTRLLVFLSAAAGMLYNALWYFPMLMAFSGCVTVVYDYRWIHKLVAVIFNNIPINFRVRRKPQDTQEVELAPLPASANDSRIVAVTHSRESGADGEESSEGRIIPRNMQLNITWQAGVIILSSFFLIFIVSMVLRGTLKHPPLLYRLFANMFLAGTIIFGGGPVVIPLLREYVVAEGWVGPRDFLIGLALIQAFPGPNFNFAVFLGSLTAMQAHHSSLVGALIAWVGIFSPGLILVHGTMGVWSALRSRPWVRSVLRGINAGAVGLIYTAVYRIWQVGYIDEGFQYGRSLGDDPWWVVVTAVSYVGGRWYEIQPPISIVFGAVLGLVRYGVVSS